MAPNAYEVLRRAAKVERLVHVIDARAARAGYDPHGDPGKIAVILEKRATEERWRQYAELAGVNPPSKLTQDAVIEVYRTRADAIEAAPRYRVRYYDARLSRRGRGVQERVFRDRANAESFAAGHKLYGERCRVEVVGGEERGAA